jgi:lysophospholipase L1-like esterase
MGLSLMQQSDKKAQAYIIGLGANDINLGASYLGQQSDVHPTNPSLNADTYYGNYGKIISAIKEIEPRAKIFVLTNPSYGNSSLRQQFNVAVRYMPTVFTNTYLIDLSESQFQSGFIDANKVSSHFTPAGYKFIATIIAREISKIIYNNASDFWFSNLIGTEYADPS